MAALAVSFSTVPVIGCIVTAFDIYRVGHGLKVSRIDAKPVLAEVIDFGIGWDWAGDDRIERTMR